VQLELKPCPRSKILLKQYSIRAKEENIHLESSNACHCKKKQYQKMLNMIQGENEKP
jgi:hypothetical protein